MRPVMQVERKGVTPETGRMKMIVFLFLFLSAH